MTREEAIYRLSVMQAVNVGAFEDSVKEGLKADEPYAPGETMTFREFFKAEHEAYNMAIKALESKDVLDMIRAEIAAYGSIWVDYVIPGHTDHDIEVIVKDVLKQAKEQVLAMIDKYKAESEEA